MLRHATPRQRAETGRLPEFSKKYGTKYLGSGPNFPEFSAQLRKETLVGHSISLDMLIETLSNHMEYGQYRSPMNIYALTIALFLKHGVEFAVNELDLMKDSYEVSCANMPEYFGGSWEGWRQHIIDGLDKERIKQNRAEFLAENNLKIRDYGLAGVEW